MNLTPFINLNRASFRLAFLGCSLTCLSLNAVWAQGPPPPAPPPGTTAQPAPNSSRTGSIAGRVLSEDGAPAAFASVTAFTGSSSSGFINRSVTADAEGNFVIRDLPARTYRFNAGLPGYVSNDDPLESGRYRLGDNVTLNLVKGGVITGRVTNSAGEPVIAVTVGLMRVRDAEGRPVPETASGRAVQTDDQGVYRIYGLRAGSYVVVANSPGTRVGVGGMVSAYDGDTAVYHPASTRETAQEVQVTAGVVTSGIDIRFRSEPGRTLSGKLSGAIEAGNSSVIYSAQLILRQAATGVVAAYGNAYLTGPSSGFELRGIVDGEYELLATRYDNQNGAASAPRRVSVRGADVSGLDLVLAPLATISGRVVLEAEPANPPADAKCTPKRTIGMEEIQLRFQSEEQTPFPTLASSDGAPDDKGAFAFSNLLAGRYRLLADLPSESWYLKSITTGAEPVISSNTPQPRRTAAAAPPANLFSLRGGDKLSNVTLTLAGGAATLQGRVSEGSKVTGRWRVHLVPADPAAADNVLRYYETHLRPDGSFQFQALAPGKYWVLTRPLPEDSSLERPPRPVSWEPAERAKLRREAEAAKRELELTACQRLTDYKLTAK